MHYDLPVDVATAEAEAAKAQQRWNDVLAKYEKPDNNTPRVGKRPTRTGLTQEQITETEQARLAYVAALDRLHLTKYRDSTPAAPIPFQQPATAQPNWGA